MSTTLRQPDRVIAQAMLAAAADAPADAITADEVAALECLLADARRYSGQSRRVALSAGLVGTLAAQVPST